ncbi:ACR3 family arsenite efflux pump ArsB [Clostridioides mangenotii]|uniref:ACR3 family arsenite efflux pump ArsB n=2 Tax=Metaclostridioides mangenotii TaxID=1540 RepID=A0ABS4E8E9_9FIRM|nr:ACR3 family arsenite efflux pump ArsB [Clostridioides mangenotii]
MKRILSKSTKGASIYGMFKENEDNVQITVLCLAVVAMFASQGELLVDNPPLFLMMLIPLILFFVISFVLALFIGKCLKMPYSDRISLLFTTSARNSPISLAIATVTFPDRPVISLALVIGPLIELPILSIYTYIVQRIKNRINSKS